MKLVAMLAFLVTFGVTQVYASVAQDTFAHSTCGTNAACDGGAGLALTYPITVGSGSNRQLGVFAFVTCGGTHPAPTVTGITYAGTPLIQKVATSPNQNRNAYLYTWPTGSQPTSGTNNVVVTISAQLINAATCVTNGKILSNAIAVTGNDQTTTLRSSNSNAADTGTALTVTLSASNAGDFAIQSACQGTGLTSTTQSSLFTPEGDANESCGTQGAATATGGTTSFDWTASGSDSWIMLAAAFQAASGGATQRPLYPIIFQ